MHQVIEPYLIRSFKSHTICKATLNHAQYAACLSLWCL